MSGPALDARSLKQTGCLTSRQQKSHHAVSVKKNQKQTHKQTNKYCISSITISALFSTLSIALSALGGSAVIQAEYQQPAAPHALPEQLGGLSLKTEKSLCVSSTGSHRRLRGSCSVLIGSDCLIGLAWRYRRGALALGQAVGGGVAE